MNSTAETPDSPTFRPVGNAVVKRGLFGADECEQLRSIDLPWQDARLSGMDADVDANPDAKEAARQLVPLSDDFRWIYERLAGLVKSTNALGFDIKEIHAPLKVQRYEGGGFHCWHNDIANPRYRTRKLGITVQLSPPDSYDDGDFQLFDHPDPVSIPREIGCAAIYPAYMVHRVDTITAGVRYSLTAWVVGPPLR